MWERWDGLLEDGRVNEKKQGKDNMVSFNHYAYGAIGEWLYKRVGGISLLPPTEKGGTFLFWVLCNETIEWAKTSFESVFGKVSCSWRMDKNRWHIEIHIPANTKGMVRIPCVDETLIEGMRVHWEKDESYMQCIIGSGIYRMSYPKKTTKSSCIEEGEITNESISG